jgi:hypothetical protein
MTRGCAAALVAAVLLAAPAGVGPSAAPRIAVMAVPDNGLQPQAVVDRGDTVHLLYFKGEPGHGDLFYARLPRGAASFTSPIRVNSEAGSAIATGSVRGGRLALGRDGWVHVAWNGNTGTTMWYARLSPRGTVEPQRSIGSHHRHLDGGGSIAADAGGRVAVVWHAAGDVDGEEHRRIYVARSTDDGARFGAETGYAMAGGNCGCCRLDSLVDAHGDLQVLYRAASGGVHRDATWLSIHDGKSRPPVTLQRWQLPACPMTTFALAETGGRLVAAWETAHQIYSATLDPSAMRSSSPQAMQGSGIRKHPAVAINAAGDRLFAWTEGTAWARGGSAAWELRGGDGRQLGAAADAGPVPVWGLVAAVARADGSFLILR